VLRRSLELAGESDVGVRLRVAGGEVRPRFVAEPLPGDEVVEVDGVRIFVAASIVEELGDVVVDVTPEHGTLVVRSGAGT
jgi:Fe-S cluster assembly iron-binding protein IscA